MASLDRTLSDSPHPREASHQLLDYLRSSEATRSRYDPPCSISTQPQDERIILELGSGTGYVGIQLANFLEARRLEGARLGREMVVMTDLPDVCALIKRNLLQHRPNSNRTCKVLVAPLSWGNTEHIEQLVQELATQQPFSNYTHYLLRSGSSPSSLTTTHFPNFERSTSQSSTLPSSRPYFNSLLRRSTHMPK